MLASWEGPATGQTLVEFLRETDQTLNNMAKLDYFPGSFLKDNVQYVLPPEVKPTLTKTVGAMEGDGIYPYSVWFNPGAEDSGIEADDWEKLVNLSLVDTFDSRLEYVAGSVEVSIWDPMDDDLPVATYSIPEVAEESAIKIVEGEKTTTMTVSTSALFELENYGKDYQYEFTYKLQVKDEVKKTATQGELHLENAAVIQWEQAAGTPESLGPAKCEVVYDTGILQKDMKRLNELQNLLEFTILVNENGLNLVGELEGSPDTFVLQDEMSSNLTLIYTSLKIELLDVLDENGNPVVRTPEECAFAYNPDENSMSLTLPDGHPIRLTYNCKVTGDSKDTVTVKNTVRIEGYQDIHDEKNTTFVIHENTGTVGNQSIGFMLQKQDGYNFKPLPGVSFELYGDVKRSNGNSITVQGKQLWYYATFTTDQENGMVLIDTLSAGHLYALKELTPPNGYLSQEEPYLFYMENPPDGNALDVDIVAEGSLVVIKNYPISYTLPKTGAAGTHWFTLCGLILCLPVIYQFYRKRRKEDFDSL